MGILNEQALNEWKNFAAFAKLDKGAVDAISQMEDDVVCLVLYGVTLDLKKFKSGVFDKPTFVRVIDSLILPDGEKNIMKSYISYLFDKIEQSESYDKVPFLKSLGTFINWLGSITSTK